MEINKRRRKISRQMKEKDCKKEIEMIEEKELEI